MSNNYMDKKEGSFLEHVPKERYGGAHSRVRESVIEKYEELLDRLEFLKKIKRRKDNDLANGVRDFYRYEENVEQEIQSTREHIKRFVDANIEFLI